MRLIIYCLLPVFIFSMVSCSDHESNGLESKYDRAVFLYKNKEFDESLVLLDQSLASVNEENELVAKAYYLRGFIAYLKNNPRKAYDDYLDAQQIFKSLGDAEKVARLNNEIGQIFYELELYDQSLYYFQNAFEGGMSSTRKEQGNFLYGIAKSYSRLKKYEVGMDYFIQSMEVAEEYRNYSLLSSVHLELGVLQLSVGNVEQAIVHYQKVEDLASFTSNPDRIRWSALNNVGNAYLELGNIVLAKEYLLKALELESGDSQFSVTYNNLGKVYNREKKYKKAWACFKKSIEYNREKIDIDELSITNAALRKMYTMESQPDSLLYYTMKINDLAMPVMQARDQLKGDDEKVALLTKYQDYQALQAQEEQQAQMMNMAFWILLLISTSGLLGFKLWRIYNYHAVTDKHKLLKNSTEMAYLLDLFKKEKDEMKKMMNQQL